MLRAISRAGPVITSRRNISVAALNLNLRKMATSEPPAVTESPIMCYNWICPYVHRLTLALAHKQATDRVKLIDIDLANKPAWLPRFSPLGKVPAVTYLEGGEQQVLIESLVLIQWVQDFFTNTGPSLVPASAAAAARMRIVISRFDSAVTAAFNKVLSAKDEGEAREALEGLHRELDWLEGQMDAKGPFMLGATPTLADAACAPWLLRTFVLKHWRNVDVLAKHPKLQAWLKHYEALPEVQSTFRPPAGTSWAEKMNEIYGRFTGGVQLDCSKL